MKLSTRSRYGTRMMLDLAQRYDKGPVQINDISKRLDISVKYLEQIIIPLKKANFIESIRGPKGGHMLAKPPEKLTIGEIVKVLEGGIDLSDCIESPDECVRSGSCLMRDIWKKATDALYEILNSITLLELIEETKFKKMSEEE